ncbi:hypothetical protein IH879_06240 [candidate division KSB1 bacterium]|nr:hypothetical protein [candidate division KSB1 bacterium]
MKNPFIAGNWVRGENFFGRRNLIKEYYKARVERLPSLALLQGLSWLVCVPPMA